MESEELEKEVAKLLLGIKFTKGFTNALTRQVDKYLKNKDKEEAKVRKYHLNKRASLVTKRNVLEERLLDNTIDREMFKRKHAEIQADIDLVDTELVKLESGRKFDFDMLEEVLALTRNIPKAYSQAPDFLKKKYLYFFFDKVMVNDKKIENTIFSPLVTELINQQQVILRRTQLPLIGTLINNPSSAYLDKQSETMLQSLFAYQQDYSRDSYLMAN